MFTKLKQRWKVNSTNLFLIIATFAIGGSLCGYAARKLLGLTAIESRTVWIALYIIIMTLIWPLCVLLVSLPLGQFSFFKRYLLKIWGKMQGKKNKTVHVAIFASGAGSNAQKIIDRFRNDDSIKISLIVCNREGAGVLKIAEKEKIPSLLISRKIFLEDGAYISNLQKHSIDFIVLAGFLWKVPPALINAYPEKIINIHPALLPKFGGRGMYGNFVHEAVIAAGEKQSGISIHYVDEVYDHGKTIFQASCNVDENETAESLAKKIHLLEHEHYPRVIEDLLKNKNSR